MVRAPDFFHPAGRGFVLTDDNSSIIWMDDWYFDLNMYLAISLVSILARTKRSRFTYYVTGTVICFNSQWRRRRSQSIFRRCLSPPPVPQDDQQQQRSVAAPGWTRERCETAATPPSQEIRRKATGCLLIRFRREFV